MPVVFQPDGGFVVPERCIVAHVEAAQRDGAVVRARERVLEWEARENGVRVTTDRGLVEADRLVLTAGAWSQEVARLSRRPSARRPPGARVVPADAARGISHRRRSPSSTSDSTGSTSTASRPSGSPASSSGATTTTRPAATRTRSRASRHSTTRRRCARSRSGTSPKAPARRSPLKTCLFEPSPDEHFLIDLHPETELAVVGAGLLGPRLQVLLGRRRDPRRPGDRRSDAARHRLSPLRPLRVGAPYPCVPRGRGGTGRRGGFRSRWAARPLEVRVLPPAWNIRV